LHPALPHSLFPFPEHVMPLPLQGLCLYLKFSFLLAWLTTHLSAFREFPAEPESGDPDFLLRGSSVPHVHVVYSCLFFPVLTISSVWAQMSMYCSHGLPIS
jgi:hypothetical protein